MATNIILEKYRDYLEDLAKRHSEETFTNAGKEHASILMSTLLNYTQGEARIFCEGFKPELITTQPYWNSLEQYLKEDSHKLYVMVETDLYLDKEPLAYLQRIKNNRKDDTIQVRRIKADSKDHLFVQLNTLHCNFAVFDQDKFRLEYIPERYQAIGSFNQPENCGKLTQLFDNAFSQAEVLI